MRPFSSRFVFVSGFSLIGYTKGLAFARPPFVVRRVSLAAPLNPIVDPCRVQHVAFLVRVDRVVKLEDESVFASFVDGCDRNLHCLVPFVCCVRVSDG